MVIPQESKVTITLRDGNINLAGTVVKGQTVKSIKGNGQVKKRMGISNGQSARRQGLNESSIYGEWINPGKEDC